MAIERSDSQQTTCNAMAELNGERRMVASATCSIRPGKSLNISVNLMDGAEQADQSEISGIFSEYLKEEIEKAAALGIPVALAEM